MRTTLVCCLALIDRELLPIGNDRSCCHLRVGGRQSAVLSEVLPATRATVFYKVNAEALEAAGKLDESMDLSLV
jgi:hypothetical protein